MCRAPTLTMDAWVFLSLRLLELAWRARFAAHFLCRVRRIEATLLRLLLEELRLVLVLARLWWTFLGALVIHGLGAIPAYLGRGECHTGGPERHGQRQH